MMGAHWLIFPLCVLGILNLGEVWILNSANSNFEADMETLIILSDSGLKTCLNGHVLICSRTATSFKKVEESALHDVQQS